jgi:hypothetical protein
MRSAFATAAFLGLVACAGCEKGTPGGPGATNKYLFELAETAFSLSVPTGAIKLKQGESKVLTIGIKRGKSFGEDVTLSFDKFSAPYGFTINPEDVVMRRGDNQTMVTVAAAGDTHVGTFPVRVKGRAAKGGPLATNELQITVVKK